MSDENPKITIQIPGVVIPSWLAVCLLATAIFAALSMLMSWQQQRRLEQEIRILQIHCADIQNVLVRSGVATRDDFISRTEEAKPQKPKTDLP